MFFGVCVAGGGTGAEEWRGGGQLPGDGGVHWGFKKFGAGGGGVVGAEEIGGSEQIECDGYALLFGFEPLEERREPGEGETGEGARVGVKSCRVRRKRKRQQSCRSPHEGAPLRGVFGEEGDVLQAGLADLVEDGFDVDIFRVRVDLDVDGFIRAVAYAIPEHSRQIAWCDPHVAKTERTIAGDYDC